MEIKTLEGMPLLSIAKTFNKAFSDYSIPISYTDENFENKIISEGIDLTYSPGAFVDGELVGFILHGLDKISGELKVFNAGTGVVPVHRGKRVVDKLYDYILPILAEKGYYQHQLEVLESNEKAEKIYEAKGFKRVRTVNAYKGIIIPKNYSGFNIRKVTSLNWAEAESFWNVQPTWQNYTQCILRAPHLHKIIEAEINGNFAGYAVTDITSGRLKQFAVKPEFRRRGIGSALFSSAANEKGEVSFINFDESDKGSIAFFELLGLKPLISLYEMEMQYHPEKTVTL
jgi:ribosomal protein S18 acetylase RimI-like enzyme